MQEKVRNSVLQWAASYGTLATTCCRRCTSGDQVQNARWGAIQELEAPAPAVLAAVAAASAALAATVALVAAAAARVLTVAARVRVRIAAAVVRAYQWLD